MIFTNARTIDKHKNKEFRMIRRKPNPKPDSGPESQDNQSMSQMSTPDVKTEPNNLFMIRPRTYLERKTKDQETRFRPSRTQTIQQKAPSKKVQWGEPFWNLFHVLSFKIIEDQDFEWKKVQFLNIVTMICQNLPCPDCAAHATNYLNHVDFRTIRSKSDLQQFFYDFHNEVNGRRGIPLYPRHLLEEKYSKGVTINIIHEFMKQFETKYRNVHLLSTNLHRGGVATQIKRWFNECIMYFAP